MGLLNVFQKQNRSLPFDNPQYTMSVDNVDTFLNMFGSRHSDSGEVVTPHTSMQLATVFSCVRIIAEQIAINPLFMYQVDGEGQKRLAVDHDYFDLVTNRPNDEQDAIQFRTASQSCLLLWGNSYIELERDNSNRVTAMWNRHPSITSPIRDSKGRKAFVTKDSPDKKERFILNENMIHLMGVTFDGEVGISPVEFARQSIGGNLAMDKFSNRFFANYAMPQMALLTKKLVKPEVKQQMRTDWENQHSGSNQHRLAVLDGEMDIKTLSVTQEQAQFLESKLQTKQEVAALFGVPGHMLGMTDKGVKANVEQQSQDFYTSGIRPWAMKWEKAVGNKLFSNKGRSAGRYIVKFDMSGFIRGDSASRIAFYQTGIQNGILSPNEAREMEGLNSIGPDGDGHYIQLNMQSLALANSTDPSPDGPNTELAQELEENSFIRRVSLSKRMALVKQIVEEVKKSEASVVQNETKV